MQQAQFAALNKLCFIWLQPDNSISHRLTRAVSLVEKAHDAFVEKEIRQKLADTAIDEVEYMEDASEISGFCQNRSKLAMEFQHTQGEEDQTWNFVKTQLPATKLVYIMWPVQISNLDPASLK